MDLSRLRRRHGWPVICVPLQASPSEAIADGLSPYPWRFLMTTAAFEDSMVLGTRGRRQ
jgi:hypothetical protein